jgi:hypothetical protein
MVSLSVRGTLGKFGYSNIPDDIVDEILQVSGLYAQKVAIQRAPYDLKDKKGIHIKDHIKYWFDHVAKAAYIVVASVYGNVAEYGTKLRRAYPFIRPAGAAARTKMRSIIRPSVKSAVRKRKRI